MTVFHYCWFNGQNLVFINILRVVSISLVTSNVKYLFKHSLANFHFASVKCLFHIFSSVFIGFFALFHWFVGIFRWYSYQYFVCNFCYDYLPSCALLLYLFEIYYNIINSKTYAGLFTNVYTNSAGFCEWLKTKRFLHQEYKHILYIW